MTEEKQEDNVKRLTESQYYSLKVSREKLKEAEEEAQDVLNNVATEQGVKIGDPNDKWTITPDLRFMIKVKPPVKDPDKKGG